MSEKVNQPLGAPDIGNRTAPTSTQKEKTTYTLAELLSMEVTELPCLFEPIFLKSGIAVLVGGSDTGKSSLLRQMCMSVATGRDFLGWRYCGKHHRAIYFSSEDDAIITARVVKRYNKTMQLPSAALQNLRFEFEVDPNNIAKRVVEMLKEQPADLVVIDAFADAFNGKNLNDNKEVRAFYAEFKMIAKAFNCLIVFNHHAAKRSDERGVSKDNSLGSQAIEAAPRIAIELRQDPNDPEIKHFCITKSNYLPTEYKTQSYALKMDENWVFARTGERVAFSELARVDVRSGRKSKKPEDYPDETHREFIHAAFNGGELCQTELYAKLGSKFELSTETAKKWAIYYCDHKWIKPTGKGGQYNRVMYVSLLK